MRSLWLLALAACGAGAPPERLQDCGDPACQSAWVQAHVALDPKGTAAAVAALSDPVAQLALIEVVGSTEPQQLGTLCEALPQNDVRGRCSDLAARGHLWKKQMSRGQGDAGAAAGGESEALADLVPEQSATLSLTRGVTPTPVDGCSSVAQLCQTEAAVAAAADRAKATGYCLAIEDDRWKSECFFKAAEAAFSSLPDERAGDATALCLGAGDYAQHCLRHLTWVSARHAPNALSGDQADWDGWDRFLQGLATPLAPDPTLQRTFLDIAWANGLRAAYDGQLAISGRPLALVPPERQQDVRAAAVWRLWNLEAQQERDLAGWVARASEVLGDQERRPAGRRATPREHLDWLGGWTEVLPAEHDLPRVSLLGMGHRTTADDVGTDLAICVLEAAGHAGKAPAALLHEGLSWPDARVRWTALRLLALRFPGRPELATMLKDPDPAVAARARTINAHR